MSVDCRALLKRIDRRVCLYVFCVLLPFLLSPLAVSPSKESRCAYVMLVVALYWVLEPLPVAVTALIPVVLFPLLGVVDSKDVCQNYMKESLMLFIGGLIVAVAVEDCNLHERIALRVLLLVGTEIKWLLIGFMFTTMFLSMWVSNTATTAMMVPIVEAIIREMSVKDDIEMKTKDNSEAECKQVENPESERYYNEETSKADTDANTSTMKVALLLSVCYAANIGGTGTLTGTNPNLVFKGLVEKLHPGSEEITYASWLIYNVPGMLLCVGIAWFYLWLVYVRCSKANQSSESNENIKQIISKRYAALGSISAHEMQVLVFFVILIFLWVFRDPKFITGWSVAIGSDTKIGDSVPAIAVSFLYFFLPANPRKIGGKPILQWRTAQAKLQWGVLILIGGGFALAEGAEKSGLSRMIGNKLSSLSVLPPGAIITIICFMTAMFTEIMSNTATANILLPVISQMAMSIGVNPLYMMLPVTVVCSYAFMLPVATPPNAIAFESGKMKTIDMAKPGLVMNLVCCAVQLFMINTLGVAMFDLNTYPTWATTSNSSEPYFQTEMANLTSIQESSLNSSMIIPGT